MKTAQVEKAIDRAELLIQFPFYLPMKWYIKKHLATKEGRQQLYLRTQSFFPFRRLSVYILDHIFVELTKEYTLPSYQVLAGFVMDLKHLVGNWRFVRRVFETNYKYTLQHIADVLSDGNKTIESIIDIGCGSGMLTNEIKELHPLMNVVGFDMRDETIEYNKILFPNVDWQCMSSLDAYMNTIKKEHTLLILNGVINFMKKEELEHILRLGCSTIVWFYHTGIEDLSRMNASGEYILDKESDHYVHYNLPRFLSEHQYTFVYDAFKHKQGTGYFIHGVSQKNN